MSDTKSIEDTTSTEHETLVEMKEDTDINKCKFGEETKMTQSYFDELIDSCDVEVDDVPRITKTNIGSYGASSCKFFLLTGIYQDRPFAYLDHDVIDYEDGNVLHVLYCILDYIAKKLIEDLIIDSSETLADLMDIHLILGGGQKKSVDILRNALSLMINPHINDQNKAKEYFDDVDVNILYDKLIKHIIILKSISYLMSDLEEEEAKKVEDPSDVINPPSLALYYDCVIDRGYLAIEWGKGINLIHLAYMLFGLRSTDKLKLTWDISYNQIEQIKIVIDNQSSDQALLEKTLRDIPDDPLFHAIYID